MPGKESPADPSLNRVNRRALLRWCLSGTATALVAACSSPQVPNAPTAPPKLATAAPAQPGTAAATAPPRATVAAPPSAATATPAPKPQATDQPRSGGTLRTGIPADIMRLDGHIDGGGTRTTFTQNLGLAFDQLVYYDAKLQPQPMLAENWEVSPDYKQVKLNLRRGVQWHSGRDFTSDDVKWNLFRGRDPKAGVGSYVNQSSWFHTIETPDKYTAILSSDISRPAMFDYFNSLSMIDQQTMEGPDAGSKLIGTGPFTFVEWDQGNHLKFTKNRNYWRSGRPYLDAIEVNILRDTTAMVTRLEAGALDAVFLPSFSDFARLKADPNYAAITPTVTVATLSIGANMTMPPTDNKKVRQALNYAIDRKRFADTGLGGAVAPLSLPWDPNSLAYEAAKANHYTFDLNKARALLDESGVTGIELDILPSPAQPELGLFCELYQGDLARLGIKLNIKALDSAAWAPEVNNRRYRGLWASTIVAPLGEPASSYTNSRGTDPTSNNSGFKGDRYSDLIARAGSESDVATRKRIYSELNDIMLDESFVMYMCPFPVRMLTRAAVRGLVSPESPGTFLYTHAWLAA